MKKLPVYCWKQQDSHGNYVYSVIRHPPIAKHSQLSKLLDPVAAARKGLNAGGASAEIGIASFMDVKWFARFVDQEAQEHHAAHPWGGQPPSLVKHSLPGQVGRPRHHEHPGILARILAQGGLELEEEAGSDEEEVQAMEDLLRRVEDLPEAEQEEVLDLIVP